MPDYAALMTQPLLHIRGMPYVPGSARGVLQHGMGEDSDGRIVVLETLLSGSLPHHPAGIVVINGAPLSHAMIPLFGSGVPTVLVTPAQAAVLREGVEVLLDGSTGLIISSAVATTGTGLPPVLPPAVTSDGTRITLRVSARDPHAAQRAVALGAESIGLVRSEFLVPADARQRPDAAFFRQAFAALCAAAGGLPVTIRLIDIAADKQPAWLPAQAGVGGALGRQGVRLYADPVVHAVYRAQLEAIDSLAAEGELRVLLPYVADRVELEYWCRDIQAQLSRPLPIGAMAETPAAALALGEWLEVADFVGLGCNDLMQCLFGADRDRPELAHYLDPHAPALYRFLHQVARGIRGQGERVQLCGVLPQLPGILPVLLGLGFRVFSVEAAQLPWLVQSITQTDIGVARDLAEQVCRVRSSQAVRELLGLAASRES